MLPSQVPVQIVRLRAERDELDGALQLQLACMARARQRWQIAHSEDYWPDGARNICWLLKRLEKAEASRDKLMARAYRQQSHLKHPANLDPRTARIQRIVEIAEKRFERFGCPYGAGKQKFDAKLGCCQGCKEKDMCRAVRGEEPA